MKIHLISGLPRSGSTLLAAILRQNPRFHASMSVPLADIVANIVQTISGHEGALFISETQRERILREVVNAYYAELSGKVVFDTNRRWCSLLPLVARILPEARVICCLRNPAWIIDSIERAVQLNPLSASKMFGDQVSDIYRRVDILTSKSFLAPAANALKQAWYSEHAKRLIAVRYDSLAQNPGEVMGALYTYLGEPSFEHNFEDLEYDEPQFDQQLGLPGFHRVGSKVHFQKRDTILPPDLFDQYNQSFWDSPQQNPRSIPIL